jgi:hypothetical protein
VSDAADVSNGGGLTMITVMGTNTQSRMDGSR